MTFYSVRDISPVRDISSVSFLYFSFRFIFQNNKQSTHRADVIEALFDDGGYSFGIIVQ